jgi:hypothetical protein
MAAILVAVTVCRDQLPELLDQLRRDDSARLDAVAKPTD